MYYLNNFYTHFLTKYQRRNDVHINLLSLKLNHQLIKVLCVSKHYLNGLYFKITIIQKWLTCFFLDFLAEKPTNQVSFNQFFTLLDFRSVWNFGLSFVLEHYRKLQIIFCFLKLMFENDAPVKFCNPQNKEKFIRNQKIRQQEEINVFTGRNGNMVNSFFIDIYLPM